MCNCVQLCNFKNKLLLLLPRLLVLATKLGSEQVVLLIGGLASSRGSGSAYSYTLISPRRFAVFEKIRWSKVTCITVQEIDRVDAAWESSKGYE